jgi:hypothetical protein
MDKIIKITVSMFIIILAGFIATVAYNGYIESAYRDSVSGSYTYSFTITTDSRLSNVTFFIPVPADRSGNSPMVSQFSDKTMNGIPADWKTALFDTGKATLLKIQTPSIVPPEGTTPSHPLTITFTSNTSSRKSIDTRNPIENAVMFHPVQGLRDTTCVMDTGNQIPCSVYTTSLYADYRTSSEAKVIIRSTLTGKNSWTVFEPRSNEYQAGLSLIMTGENHGWVTMEGKLISGTGVYNLPNGS